jgi:hypothetical protein
MSWRAVTRLARAFAISNRPVVWLLPVQKQPVTRIDKKMLATRVTESYASLFRPSKHDGDSRHAAIARIGAFEVRLLEMPSVHSPEEASLWVELYDLDLRLGVDSYKCSHLDAAIDAAHVLMIKAKLLNGAGEAAPSSFEELQENL